MQRQMRTHTERLIESAMKGNPDAPSREEIASHYQAEQDQLVADAQAARQAENRREIDLILAEQRAAHVAAGGTEDDFPESDLRAVLVRRRMDRELNAGRRAIRKIIKPYSV